ncbi:MAG: Sir2 family NAD-dependent protein deacetylase [Desulfobacterales bacterium]|nr:Sir2 family NAD-dependent protein deacetylase [Desulfobacterales bacterium]
MKKDPIAAIAGKIAEGGRNLFFTGAGISTESGIPDYRSQGGIWDQFRPVYFDDFMSSRDARIEYWRQKTELYPDLTRARPNAGHLAIATLFGMGLVEAVITQNIDGLHQAAGIPGAKVIELHGNTTRVRCMTCGALSDLGDAQARIKAGDPAPECFCGGYLKPDTISFGQAMPEAEVARAVDHCRNCDFFCVVGSTLLVQPAAQMPLYARHSGAFLAIVNLSETPCDGICHARVCENAGPVLAEIADRVTALTEA